MLSIFPSLLAFEGFAPFLLRLILGSVFIFWARKTLKSQTEINQKSFAIFELIIGISLIIGLFTQLSALISLFILGYKLIKKIQSRLFLNDGINYYFILFIISICILISGSGFIAFDLPL